MTPARLRVTILIAAPLLMLLWFWWWSGAAVQAERTFHGLKSAIEQGRAGAVLDHLHPDYDIAASWPSQFGDGAGDLGIGNGTLRVLALRGLTALFQLQQPDPFVFTYTINAVEELADGTVAVTVAIGMSTQAGHQPLTFTPSLLNQRFVLAREGWWPALSIRSHPPFSVSY